MLEHEILNLAEKLFFISTVVLRWESRNMNGCYDVNGKKPEIMTKTQIMYSMIISSLENATATDIEKILGLSKSSVSLTVSRMVDEGYVIRRKGDDGRKSYLALTEKAEMALANARKVLTKKFEDFYIDLNSEQKEMLKTAIESAYLFISNKEDSKNEI
ncbi:MAG: MarR family transcriptional regulator [Firmicutes bacterium]|nr:MarR family transcriptional regulator [Bacillota bacterium]